MAKDTIYIVEGKFTTGKGSEYETLETVYPADGGMKEAQRLAREHSFAYGGQYPVRYRRATDSDNV